MKIGIVGCGFVGTAVKEAHKNDTVMINDPKLENSVSLSQFFECDAVYICVPSPQKDNGECDTSILEGVLRQLTVKVETPIISKVTAPPSEYERLEKLYPNLVYSPEFLTAANATEDYVNAQYIIVGGEDYTLRYSAAKTIQSTVGTDEFFLTDIKTASAYKYMMNSYLAMKVTFMNDFYLFAKEQNINWDSLILFAKNDNRIGDTHMTVPGPDGQFGWGGYCFPKDLNAITNSSDQLQLLKAVIERNKTHRNLEKSYD